MIRNKPRPMEAYIAAITELDRNAPQLFGIPWHKRSKLDKEMIETTDHIYSAVPFDFSDLIDELQDYDGLEMGAYLQKLPPTLPPYPIVIVDSGYSSGIAIFETQPISETRYETRAYLLPPRDPYFALAEIRVFFDEKGNFVPDEDGQFQTRLLDKTDRPLVRSLLEKVQNDPEKFNEYAVNALAQVMTFAFFGFSLLNCKNVGEKTVIASRQVNRARARKNLPGLGWKVLTLTPLRKPRNARETAEVLDESTKRRLHTVRGHFSTYTEAAPLFGKHVGTYYVPAHWRGDLDSGKLNKSYRLTK